MIEPPPTNLQELVLWREKYRKYLDELAKRIYDYVEKNGPTKIEVLMRRLGERRIDLELAIDHHEKLVFEGSICYAKL